MHSSEDTSTTNTSRDIEANPGYALGQLARAFATSETDPDPEVRSRARQKITRWIQVFQGMLSGALHIGSRVPVARTPAWATLEVVTGGFATGELLAGGALQPHEHDLLRRLPAFPAGGERVALNSYFLSDAGLDALRQKLASGRYRIRVPEEGALLVVAWLLDHGHADQARALLDEIGPFMGRLRFYPVPAERPLAVTTALHRQTAGDTVRDLQALRMPRQIALEREAVTVWTPLYDHVVALFVETVAGPLPGPRIGPDGTPLRRVDGQFLVDGGWPCQHYPHDWRTRAQTVLDDYQRLRPANRLCGKPDQPSENFAILRTYLAQCVADPGRLSGRDVGRIRAILGAIAAKRGLPGSPRSEHLRQAQVAQAARPTTAELAPLLIDRLSGMPLDEGVTVPDELLTPVSVDEAVRFRLPVDQSLPPGLEAKLWRCIDASVEVLVERGVLPSGEVLARVIPQLTAQLRAAELADAELRRLYGAIYAAFRRRRSLLLLNLEHQVRLEELPWVAAITTFRTDDERARTQARRALEQVVTLAITAWPHQILPNKLLQEIRSLAEGARLHLPIVDEVAADIFMGTFSEKYLRSAQQAGRLLAGTLYERYYDISYAQIQQIDDLTTTRSGAPISPAFARLCFERAGELPVGGRWSVARNGKVIEQEQILTSHNLAVLWSALGLLETLEPRLDDLARRCFVWICRRQQQKIDGWQPRLRMVKNTAYAWRQMVFFLALMPAGGVESFLSWAHDHLSRQRTEFQERFRPALRGLVVAAAGGSLTNQDQPGQPDAARRFLGWTTERHWLLTEQ